MKKLALALALALAFAAPAHSQVANGRATTAAPTYSDGSPAPLSLDTGGGLRVNCITGCSGSGTTDVNLKNYGGVAVGATNGQYVRPGTGATWAATQSGTWTVQPGNTANTTPWLATINQGGNSATVSAAGALKVDGSAATQPVSGTVTANQGGTWTVQPGNTANTTAWLVNRSSLFPSGAVAETASATGTTAATAATLATAAGKTTFICGFSIRANAAAAATGNSTVAGTISGTLNFTQWTAPNASGIGITEMIFQPCVPASATNTSIVVTSAAPGASGVVSVTAWGYQQ